jgi:TRAP-type C4-dicarboxylate transport system permease small subunit
MKLEKIINSGIPILCGMLLVVMVGLTFMQVMLRNCFDSGMNWSDEVSQFCMTWLVLFSMIWATKNDQHLNTGLKLHQKLNKKLVYLIDDILALLIGITTARVAYQSAIFAFRAMSYESLSLSWLKMGYVFIAMPISMLGVSYYYLKNFLKNLASLLKKDYVSKG